MNNYMKTIISGIKTWARNLKSDWNENDPTADGYIKNRPFYTGDPVEKVLLGETSVEIAEDGGNVQISNVPMFDIGTTYYVTFNGVEYECVAYGMWEAIVVGNGAIAGGSGGNGEPFLVVGGYNFIYASEAGGHTVGISTMTPEIHKIDKKFLPHGSTIGKTGSGQFSEIFNVYEETDYGFEGVVYPNEATGDFSHAEGERTQANGYCSHAEGSYTEANGYYSHAEGLHTIANGERSHAEGSSTEASGEVSHAEGFSTKASGQYSHAEGNGTEAKGWHSHVEGQYTIASSGNQHVQGIYNIEDANNTYAHIVGNGNQFRRSNAHTLDWDGNAWYAGSLFVGGTSQDDAEEVATKSDLANNNAPKDNIALIDVVNGYTYIVEMRNGNLVSRCGVSHIEISTMPNKTEYVAGEYFDPTGMIVTATCYDGSYFEITDYMYNTNCLTSNINEISISYVESGIAHTATVSITVGEYDAEAALIDFTYTTNNDGTYTITGWKGTLNGEPSTEMIVPDNGLIKL